MAEEKTYQHIVSEGYLKAWIPPTLPPGREGQVWVIQKNDPGDKRLRSPKNHFGKNDHYTGTTEHGRDLQIENALGKSETAFGRVIAQVKRQERLRLKDLVHLSFFTAGMMVRVEAFTDRVAKMLTTVRSQMRRLEERSNGSHEQSDQLARELENIVPDTVGIGVIESQKVLDLMMLTIFTVDDEVGFITSDVPCSMCIPRPSRVPLYPSLYDPHVEVILPLSPHHVALYSWQGEGFRYASGNRMLVDKMNARTLGWCRNEFVSWKGIVRDEWFQRLSN